MLMLEILAVLAVVAGVYWAVTWFNDHCSRKFGHRFFTRTACYIAIASFAAMYFGAAWYHDALKTGGDTLNGIVLGCVGVAMILGLIIYNFKRTNVPYGLGGSIAQLALFSVLAPIGLITVMVVFFLMIMAAGADRRYDDHNRW